MTSGEWRRRLWYLLNRRRLERELEMEMSAHREMLGDARRFGNVLRLREEARDVWGWGPLDAALLDVRQAVRALTRAPAVSLTAVLILSAGIGLNLTFFHLLNVVALQPMEVSDPASLVRLERRGPASSSSGVPFPATQFIRQHSDVLSAVLTHHPSEVVWDGHGEGKLPVAYVSANWFAELGYGAAIGRIFTERIDEQPDASPVVLVSHRFWQRRLASDPGVIGRSLRLNDRLATIVGVAPARFPDLDLRDPEMWMPIHQIAYFEPGNPFRDTWHANNAEMYARLRPGVSPGAATESLRSSMQALARLRPSDFQTDEWLEAATAENRFLHARDRQKMMRAAALFGGLTLLVLLVASANLANLVLSHAIGRVREFSVRLALGASRWRILRLMVIECALVALCGGLVAIALASAGARVFGAFTDLPPYLDFSPDGRLLAAAFAIAAVSMLVFGVLPAWAVNRRDLIRGIRDGGHQVSGGLSRARFRLALVGAQILGCCALLVVAGAMARGVQRLLAADPGFKFERVVVLDPSLARHGLAAGEARAYWAEVVGRMASHPEIEQLALASPAPLGGALQTARYGDDSGPLVIAVMHVEPSFFRVLQLPLLAGRTFEPGENASTVIISREVARTMYGTLDVLGKGYPRSRPMRTIIGVAADASVTQLRASNHGEEYMPLGDTHQAGAALLAKTRAAPQRALTPLAEAARAADVRVQPAMRLLPEEYQRNLRGPRLAATIAALVAMLVLTLACLGIFGVVAYAVRLRTKEIGIRRALGASTPRLLATLLRPLAWTAAVGIAAGTMAGLAASRALGGAPFYLAVTDAVAPMAALTLFAAAGLAAALVPASRAIRQNPMQALRHD